MQGGPGVFKGDLYFYKLDGDISEFHGMVKKLRDLMSWVDRPITETA